MDVDKFIETIKQMGYTVEGSLDLKTIGTGTGYEFSLRPINQEKFNWKRCNDDF